MTMPEPHETPDDRILPSETAPAEQTKPQKVLTPAAERALAEATARRVEIDAHAAAIAATHERQGRGGLEPVRYDDWEIKGIAVDF